MDRTEAKQLTHIDSSKPGQIIAIAAVSIPECQGSPAPVVPDRLPLLLLGAVVSLGLLAMGAVVIPGLISSRVQSLQIQNAAQATELTRIKQCVGGR